MPHRVYHQPRIEDGKEGGKVKDSDHQDKKMEETLGGKVGRAAGNI